MYRFKVYESFVIATRRQASRSAGIGVFGLDVSRGILRAVTGEPESASFAKRLTGADALTLTAEITIADLEKKCREVLEAYRDDRHKQYFAWIDHVRDVRDKTILEELDKKLEQALRNKSTEKLYLVPPEVQEWDMIEAFRIKGTRLKEYHDLDIDVYLNNLGNSLNGLTIGKLKSYYVLVRVTGSDDFKPKWPLYNCLAWETTHKGRFYLLVEGRWFEVDPCFAQEVRDFVRCIPAPATGLPPAKIRETEDQYNLRVAEECDQFACLHRRKISIQGYSGSIEPCDLLSIHK